MTTSCPSPRNALFVQPVSPGPVEIDVQVLRSGRTAGQAVADLRNTHQDGTALHLTAAFGQLHESSIDYLDVTFPDVPMPDDCQPPPPRPDDSPFANINFHEQTDWRPTAWWDPVDWQPSPAVASAWTRLVKEPRLPDGTIDPVSLCIPADTLGMAIGQRVGPDPFFILTLEIGLQFFGPTESPWLLQHVRRALRRRRLRHRLGRAVGCRPATDRVRHRTRPLAHRRPGRAPRPGLTGAHTGEPVVSWAWGCGEEAAAPRRRRTRRLRSAPSPRRGRRRRLCGRR